MLDVSLLEEEKRQTAHFNVTGNTKNYVLSFLFCSIVAVILSVFFEQLFHWFLIPVVLCGTLIGSDAIEWFRKGTNAFDPKAVFGLYGLHFFFIAPILHVVLDYWMKYVTPPSDWRTWLGYMALLNLLGLAIMIFTRNHILANRREKSFKKIWLLEKKRFLPMLLLFLIASLSLQIYIYASMGGLMGYITAYTEQQTDAFQGMGILFMVSESFPILALIGFAVYAKNSKVLKSWPVVVLVLLLYVIAQLLFGGLRGSRSNTVFMLVWAVGVIHLWVRPVPKKMILAVMIAIFMFMYIYGFYKGAGIEVMEVFRNREMIPILEQKTGRDIKALLLGDLGRSDVQAFLLYRISGNSDYRLAFGRTYLGALSLLIPRQAWPNRPPTKVKEGTEALYGRGSYSPGRLVASNVYGMPGEAMLNFGYPGALIAYILIGILIAIVLRTGGLNDVDSRNLLAPLVLILPVIMFVSDLDNIIFFLAKKGLLPFLLILTASAKRVPCRLPENLVTSRYEQ